VTVAPSSRHTMRRERPRLLRGKAFDYDHEIQVALPPSYDQTDDAYPVLWVTDGSVFFDLAVGIVPTCKLEMIVVGVGCPQDLPSSEFSRRRSFDFSPGERLAYDGLGGRMVEEAHARRTRARLGGAPVFLDFLVDDVREALARDYRMDAGDHWLFGVSGGGMFVGYSLFARPGAFAKYICGSPCLNGGDRQIFALEERYAADHDDLPAKVFFGAGEAEIEALNLAAWDIVGSMASMAQTLRLRQYPSLRLDFRIFPGEGHNSVIPLILSTGLRALAAEAPHRLLPDS
jgi:uncharacterized protein